VDFFRMDLNSLPQNASSLKFNKHNSHIMGLCLTLHINLQLSLRKTARALKDLYGINISHQQVANYARTAAVVIKPFVDNYEYPLSDTQAADETYIKVRGVKGYIWFIMDVVSRSIIGYQVSDNRSVGPCIMAMRMALRGFKKLPEKFRFIADGYSAYPLAAQEFFRTFGDDFSFGITQVIGLSNDDAVSKEFRPFKQMTERLNRTFKSSYRVCCGYDNFEGANYNVSLWVAYYNFLRPHQSNNYKVLNQVEMLECADNMPGKWQLLIYLGQQTIIELKKRQKVTSACS
jgi:transposase-like protein